MIEINMANIMAQELMQKIEQEAKKEKRIVKQNSLSSLKSTANANVKNNALYSIAVKIGKFLQKKGFDGFVKKIQKNFKLYPQNRVYTMGDFTKYYDEKFIDNLYRTLLLRKAHQNEKDYYLALLRSGKLSKSEIILSLYFSQEALGQNIIILGIKKRYFIFLLYKIPLLGYMVRTVFALFTIPKLILRVNSYENFCFTKIEIQETKQRDLQIGLDTKASNQTVAELADRLETKLQAKASNQTVAELADRLETKLQAKASLQDLENYMQLLHYAQSQINLSLQTIQNLIDEAKKRLPNEVLQTKELQTLCQEEKHIFDAFYVAFEDRFRGSRDEIKKRLKQYMPYIQNLSFSKDEITILDVGCGRGEWLELLQENGYCAKGVDLNRIMAETSKELGLDAYAVDAIEYLSSKSDNSLSVITGFHIIEHLSFEILMKLFKESYRVLQKGGLIIFETPNPENIVVGACSFYTDPTHKNPLVPDATRFLAHYHGFENVEIKRLNGTFNADLQNDFLNQHFNAQFDYSVIGYKI